MSNDNLPPVPHTYQQNGKDRTAIENYGQACYAAGQRDAVAASGAGVPDGWRTLFGQVALALNCLPSCYLDGNDHVIKAAEKLAATPAQAEPSGALPEPIGYAQKQPLLEYAPCTMLYSKKLAPEDMHECVALYSEDQVRDLLQRAYAKQAIESRGALSDAAILNLSEDFKRNYHACGADVEEFDALGFAKALLASLGQQGGGDAAPKLAHGHRDDFYLMANARRVASLPIHKVVRMTNAHFASELFATGSTSGHRICVDAGIDPDSYTVERAAIQAQAGDAREGGGS